MNGLTAALVRSDEWIMVRRRIFRQLVESFLYEQILNEPVIGPYAEAEYTLRGETETGEKVEYTFWAVRKESFNRIRLSDKPIMRVTSKDRAEADSIPRFLLEMAAHIATSEAQLGQFMDELQQTHLKDTLSVRWRAGQPEPRVSEYDEWESALIEGHPYHPCYKSRVGFTLSDNEAYGPEFGPEFKLVWIAIKQDAAQISISSSLDMYAEFIHNELGQELQTFKLILQEVISSANLKLNSAADAEVKLNTDGDASVDEYVFVPVHPWQWKRIISVACAEQLRTGEIVYLGQAGDTYRPQQSIRTLTNVSHRDKPYVKLPLNMVNTSSGRILAQHTIMNAARISDWLGRVVAEDSFLQDELGLIVLKEIAGVSYHHQKLPNMLEQKIYGSLGAIWRESLHPRLMAGEEALPFNALCHLDQQGTPVIKPWINEYGLDRWARQLLNVAVVPLIHLLYAHGAALESHAQNMIIVLKEGWPSRIALKDFHDGIRYCPSIPHPFGYPEIEYPPANHQRVNRNSFVEKEDPSEVKDFILDALLFINLTEVAFFLEKHFDLSEKQWWRMAAEVILNYQERFPELLARFEQFDVFAPEIEVEQLTRRRIHEGPGDCVHRVSNPLHVYRPVRQN
ncbi:IucA/IucC family protein [Paenibacillus marchantiae]|uniref:IucA/IucC family protein n=1 Tax=Paenibacillus marchantiae TaxID=3026433 RepID=UPI00237B8B62|nr:IucA/IucC family protein [Paenibacillus marchantiae]WDQ30304.1 IucA/IucC family protein [Paenibacillus marchantiae]